jgi:hypothetical protein
MSSRTVTVRAPSAAKVRDVVPRCPLATTDLSQSERFWVSAKNLQHSIRTRVIIGDYRIDVLAHVVQCVSENKRFIANAGDSDQKSAYDPIGLYCNP